MRNAIGIDIGGTNIKYALVDENGKIIYESVCSTEAKSGRSRVLEILKKSINEVLEFARSEHLKVSGIGIGTPGIVDKGVVLSGAENLPDWEELPLANILEKQVKYRIFVDNDANLMGLGEVRFGAARNVTDAIFLTVGTGIGGAMVINGQLYGGYRNRGAELGHFIVDITGRRCGCGATGCLEAQASVTALIEDYILLSLTTTQKEKAVIDGKYIISRYLENEDSAVKAMNRHFDYLASGIAGLINIFSPQKVIIGGGIADSGSFYIANISDRVFRIAMKETSAFSVIEPALLGNKAGFLGASAIVFDNTD